ncbi:MAG TPA: ABC transporter permease [Cyclobacteriaceae bacterium]|nr:ABC transporter permease [Cyclobacteriaceae bacterium]
MKVHPPKRALKFLRWFCREDFIEEIEGDLTEIFEKQYEVSPQKAKIKFAWNVIKYFRPEFIKSFRNHYQPNSYDMYKSYFKIGWRNLMKDKMHAFINIAGLSMGMATAILIGLWMYDELSYDKSFENYDRIARVIQNVTNNGEVQTWRGVPYPLAEELRNNYGSDFKHLAMAVNLGDYHTITIEDSSNKKLKSTGGYFEKEMPEILSLNMLQGQRNALDDPSSVLISASAAKAYFGNDDPIGKVFRIDEMQPLKVAGVYKDFFKNSTFANLDFIASWDFWYHSNADLKNMTDPWRPNFVMLFAQLNDNADFENVSAKIKDAKLKKVNTELQKKQPALFLEPMSNWHLYAEFKDGINIGGAIKYVRMFGIIGMFVLLLACINFMNLSTAHSEKRAKEVGIRKAAGSLRKHLIYQFFSESLLTVTFAFVLAILIAVTALPFFNQLANKNINILWSNSAFWFIGTAFIFFTAIVAGSYPALYLSSFRPVKVLKGTFKAGRLAAIPRKVLVVLQFTVSVSLIIGTIIVYNQIQYAKDRPVGYSRANLITVYSDVHEHFDAVKNELLQTGAVVSVAEAESPTTSIWNTTSGFSWPGKDPDLSTDFAVVAGSFDYGQTIDWHIKEGRGFSADHATDSAAVILNEAAVAYMNLKNPVGQTVTWWDNPLKVIGVIENMVIGSPYSEVGPVVYSLLSGKGNMTIIRLNPAVSVNNALEKIELLFKKQNADQPFEYSFVDDEYAKKFGDEERIGKLSGIFTLLAIVISCLGLFGLTSFVAEQRKKEIGVRKVLGASVSNLWRMLSKDFVMLVIISCFIAIPVSYYFMNGWLQRYEYRTEISGWVFLVTCFAVLCITLITVSFQAIKAALINPVKSLRSE